MALTPNCKFGTTNIGDYGWVVPTFEYDLEIKKIPRATGVIINNRGGGYHILTVHAWVRKNARKDLEEYFHNLATSFGTIAKTLTINTKTYDNCYFKSITPGGEYHNYNFFTVTFIKVD
ncbi:MAG: hypothetical protein ACFFAU_01270 [Candidatus Hodarchaeota archaeon]